MRLLLLLALLRIILSLMLFATIFDIACRLTDMTFGNSVCPNVTESYSRSVLVACAQGCVLFGVIGGYPTSIWPCRYADRVEIAHRHLQVTLIRGPLFGLLWRFFIVCRDAILDMVAPVGKRGTDFSMTTKRLLTTAIIWTGVKSPLVSLWATLQAGIMTNTCGSHCSDCGVVHGGRPRGGGRDHRSSRSAALACPSTCSPLPALSLSRSL